MIAKPEKGTKTVFGDEIRFCHFFVHFLFIFWNLVFDFFVRFLDHFLGSFFSCSIFVNFFFIVVKINKILFYEPRVDLLA